jgi:RNA polymerase sigma-70 factor (ECF subfamily)
MMGWSTCYGWLVDGLDDRELARRIAGGPRDEAAEAEVVRRFAPRIRLYGLRHLRDAQAALDLVQEVLATTLTALRDGRVKEPDRLPSFVLGACRLTVTNLRRTEHRRTRLLAEFGHTLGGTAPEPGGNVAIEEDRLVPCMGRLSARERAVVVLTFYAERSADEIARELETSPGNVRVVRHRALARLHECLETP